MLIITAVVIGTLVDRQLEVSMGNSLESSLKKDCVLVSSFAERAFRGEEADVASRIRDIGRLSGLRITLIRPDGRVLADSEEDPATMDNHRNRPEVLVADTEDFGLEQRFSRTVGYPMLYVARVLFADEGKLGIVRVALPQRDLEAQRAATRRSVILGSGAGLLLALPLGGDLGAPRDRADRGDEEGRGGDALR